MHRDDEPDLHNTSIPDGKEIDSEPVDAVPQPRSDFGGTYRTESQRHGYDVGTAGYDTASAHAQDDNRHTPDKNVEKPEPVKREGPVARRQRQARGGEADRGI